MFIDISTAPELDWLKNGSVNGTPEGADMVGKEYLRTKGSIDLFRFVLNNDYAAFSACQSNEVRISQQSFDEIRKFVLEVLPTKQDQNAMEAFLLINDLGKIKDFVQKTKDLLNVQSVDHDLIMYEGLKAHPELSPTFSALDPKYQKLILEGLSAVFNMGQFVQSENFPANLEPLKAISPKAMNYYMVHVMFDIAGAACHVAQNGSLVFTEIYWKRFSWALDSIRNMTVGKYTSLQAYNEYLEKTKRYFQVSDTIVAKLCNLFGVSNTRDARKIERAFNSIDLTIRRTITRNLSKTGVDDNAILLYYAPATLHNASGYFKEINPETAISETIHYVMPIFAKVYEMAENLTQSKVGVTTFFIEDIASTAKDPEMLSTALVFKPVKDDFEVIIGKDLIINYSDEPVFTTNMPTIFLAGPSPRSKDEEQWRPKAFKILQSFGFNGIVYYPQPSTGDPPKDYDNQVAWEWEALKNSGIILFWVARKFPKTLGLTTNTEFGYYVRADNILYGRPDDADSIVYLDKLFLREHPSEEIYNALEQICVQAVMLLN